MTVEEAVSAIARGPDPEGRCRICNASCYAPPELEPTPLCNLCAQEAAAMLPMLARPGTSRVPTVLLSRLMLTLMGVCLAAKGETDSGKVVADAANILDVWEEAVRRGESPSFGELKATLDQAVEAARKVKAAAGDVELPPIVAPSRRIIMPGDE